VAKRHLDEAIGLVGKDLDVQVEWLPYFLNKDTPESGEDLQVYLGRKYGADVAARASADGGPLSVAGGKCLPPITFNKSRKIIPTLKPHRIVEWARNQPGGNEKVDELMEILFKAYFEKGDKVNEILPLLACVTEAGLDSVAARDLLMGETHTQDVLEGDRWAKTKLRVNGVPFFMFKSRCESRENDPPIGFSGAQPADLIARAMREAVSDD
jgi:predicted DsbA family dithiol-disulfide isomerase